MKWKIVSFLFLISVCLLSFESIHAQTDSANAAYLKNPHIPNFTISKCPDSSLFTNSSLKKNTKTVFIMFSPDCHFCQHETRDLLKNISKFKNTQIVMVSFMGQKLINDFYKKYQIAKYPIITMGKDSRYFFLSYFRLKIAPSTFVYDSHGNFKKAFYQIVDMDTLLKELKAAS